MLEELQRRNYSQSTVTSYSKTLEDFGKHFRRPADQLGPDEIRAYQVYLLQERKQGVRTVSNHTAALRFFFCKTQKNQTFNIDFAQFPLGHHKFHIVGHQEILRLRKIDV
jgi:site-specific recombinase XerD